ncbi:MAG: S24 family peptidase [Tissierellia bacterium]|nr:S24 family peptidase [Tissierellia bacterium]MDD4727054.1 S24 family peptidase [Tissierellia bacterium]
MNKESINKDLFSIRLKEAMIARNIIQADLVKQTGISKGAISQYISGAFLPKQDNTYILANILNIDEAWLMGHDVPMERTRSNEMTSNIIPIKSKKVPLLGEIVAGESKYTDENFQYFIDAEENINVDYCIKVVDDSMINARIFNGDIVFIREQLDVEDGEIAAVLIDDEITLKRVYKMPGRVQLRPENLSYEPINITEGEGKKVKILGKAVAFQSKVR